MKTLSVLDLYKDKKNELRLSFLSGSDCAENKNISIWELNRPGLALSGFFKNFGYDRIQVLGKGEYAYIQYSLESGKGCVKDFFQFEKIPCIIFAHALQCPPELVRIADQLGIPILVSALSTAHLTLELSGYLEEKLSASITMHGVLTDVYGVGILLEGKSGIGKSECGLELIKQGHMLVADDVVQVHHRQSGLIGSSPDSILKYHLEVRGLGIIDVRKMFGVSAILDASRIDLVIELEICDQNKTYDRIGGNRSYKEIMSVQIPKIKLPVTPGRNITALVEMSALHFRLRQRGFDVSESIQDKLLNTIKQKTENKTSKL